MNEDYVIYEIAKKLKEKGFDEPFNMYYHIHNDIADCVGSLEYTCDCSYDFINSKNKYRCSAPTISQVLKWLRKEKKIYVVPLICSDWSEDADGIICEEWLFWSYRVINVNDGRIVYDELDKIDNGNFEDYEQAALAGIEYVIDNLI